MKSIRILIAIFFLFVFLVSSAHAGELRILDQKGLTRASRRVLAAGQVVVQLSASVQENTIHLVLTPIDVIGREIEGSLVQGEVRFASVREGTWQLKGTPESAQILSVSISAKAP